MKILIKPLSTNSLWKGRKYKTKEYDLYIRDMLYLLPNTLKIDPENIHFIFHLKKTTYDKADLDNFLKPILDIMKKKGIIKDDRYVKRIVAEKVISDEYKIEIVENGV